MIFDSGNSLADLCQNSKGSNSNLNFTINVGSYFEISSTVLKLICKPQKNFTKHTNYYRRQETTK